MSTWLLADTSRYWLLAWSSFAVVLVIATFPAVAAIVADKAAQRALALLRPWMFVVAIALCLLAFRWPGWLFHNEFNPDESQFIAEALTLQHDPLFWRSVDGTTHGPLDVYPLAIAGILGPDLSYFTARVLGTMLLFVALFGCYRAARALVGEVLSRLAVIPALCFFAFSSNGEFLQYSSEQVPVALLSLGFWFLLRAQQSDPAPRYPTVPWAAAGLLLGAVPLAKLQAAPISAVLLASAALANWFRHRASHGARIRRLLLLGGAAVFPTAFFAVVVWIGGVATHAWLSYITHNFDYTSNDRQHALGEMIEQLHAFAAMDAGFYAFVCGCGAAFVGTIVAATAGTAAAWRATLWPLIFAGISLAVTLLPGRLFPHYLIFLPIPLALAITGLCRVGWDGLSKVANRRVATSSLLFVFIASSLAPQIYVRLDSPHPYLAPPRSQPLSATDPVALEIRRHAAAGDALGLWGWGCRYYVYTQMRQATREAHTYQEIMPSRLRDYYRARYLRDFSRHSPPVFVDTVGLGQFGFSDRNTQAHESFPALRDFVATHYRLAADIAGARVYVRLDRLSAD
jgi:hypothetical protein